MRSERQINKIRVEYTEPNKVVVRKCTRADKRQVLEDLAETAEISASKNEMRAVYKITQEIFRKKSTVTASLLEISRVK